jgi:hypothetical protein
MAMMKKPIKGEKKKEVKARRAEVNQIPSKGITAKPAKMRDASPNFVNDRVMVSIGDSWERRSKNEDPGSNPGGSPKIKYREAGGRQGGVRLQNMTNKGKFEFSYPKNFQTTPAKEEIYLDKKGTKKAAPKKAMASSSSKMSSTKKPMMKTTKK